MILMIDNYDSFTYNLYQIIAQHNPQVEVVRNDKISLEEIALKKPQAIILSPGPGQPTDAGICIPIINTFSGQIPILGVCLGHQAIVHAFGGQVIRAPSIVHGKSNLIYHNGKGIFVNMPQPFAAGRYHSLIAEKESLPACLTIDAQTQDGIIMAVQHKQHLTIGVQFHPESILTPDGSVLINNFLQMAR
jgi:anthranilate synthase component II